MQKLLILTDLHMVEPGQMIIGLDPGARLRAVLDHALARHGDADRMILTGDLTHHGRPAQYDRLRAALRDVPMPITYLPGNHDDRAALRAAFPEAATCADGFVQCVIDSPTHRLICLDTLDPGSTPYHAGLLCPARMDFLHRALETAAGRHCLVFQHHPPFAVGFDGMDAIALLNGDAQCALLRDFNVTHLIAGHIHRTISGRAEGVSFTIFKSPCHQMPMLLGPAPTTSSIDEPGAYGIALLTPTGVIAHSEDVGLGGVIRQDGAG